MVMLHKLNVNASNNHIRRGERRYLCAAMGEKRLLLNKLLLNVRQRFFECIF